MKTLADIMAIYEGSNGDITKSLYADLQAIGPAGVIAMNLFRATKCSARAKVYRGGGYRGQAYDRKSWSLGLLCEALERHGADLGIRYGWAIDKALLERGDPHRHILYVDLPAGQVSFHNGERKAGPEYPAQWDMIRGLGPERVCRFVADVINGALVS